MWLPPWTRSSTSRSMESAERSFNIGSPDRHRGGACRPQGARCVVPALLRSMDHAQAALQHSMSLLLWPACSSPSSTPPTTRLWIPRCSECPRPARAPLASRLPSRSVILPSSRCSRPLRPSAPEPSSRWRLLVRVGVWRYSPGRLFTALSCCRDDINTLRLSGTNDKHCCARTSAPKQLSFSVWSSKCLMLEWFVRSQWGSTMWCRCDYTIMQCAGNWIMDTLFS